MKYLITITLGLFLFSGIPSVCNAQIVKSKEAIKTKQINRKKDNSLKPLTPKLLLLKKKIELISPSNKVINVALNTNLLWETESNTNGDELSFDVYFGTEAEPITKVSSGQIEKSYTPTLEYNTTYYWKVVITSSTEETDKSVVWSFKTELGIVWSDDSHGTYTDPRDGNSYNVVKIGEQVWFAENLAYLPKIIGNGFGSHSNPNYYVYGYRGNDVEIAKTTFNYQEYGVLYNWPAAMNSSGSSDIVKIDYSASTDSNPSGIKGACPCGWHFPSANEWGQLFGYLYDNGATRDNIGKALAAKSHWDIDGAGLKDIGYRPTNNSSGFTALPGGCGFIDMKADGVEFNYKDLGYKAYFWTASGGIAKHPKSSFRNSRRLHNKTLRGQGGTGNFDSHPNDAYSVRCVKD